MPDWVRAAIAEAGLNDAYEARPPYQRNDYIGWITKAKRTETQQRRVAQMLEELRAGDVYMKMCWGPKAP
ncbi:MAG: YdeI/OmpD-associated family protein [Proteobacteria bacterium]|nr:YdeI/OmpD-associated family protein [Pseudomonadota bacterium]